MEVEVQVQIMIIDQVEVVLPPPPLVTDQVPVELVQDQIMTTDHLGVLPLPDTDQVLLPVQSIDQMVQVDQNLVIDQVAQAQVTGHQAVVVVVQVVVNRVFLGRIITIDHIIQVAQAV